MADIILNSDQQYASDKGAEWYQKIIDNDFKYDHDVKQVFEVSGPAGSGKTTIADHLTRRMNLKKEEVLYSAYVGKAAMQLARNGLNAKTIHSTIYNLVEEPVMDENGEFVTKNNRLITKPTFQLKEKLDIDAKMIFIDEGSMVNDAVAKDLKSFKIPLFILGDLNQLPPVFGKPAFLNTPDVVLKMIMRQAADSNIIKFSQLAIQGKEIPYGNWGDVLVIPKDKVTDLMIEMSDVVLCGKNSTRDALNKYIRQDIFKFRNKYPMVGEKLICRQNNWRLSINDDIYLINGMLGYVEEVYKESFNGRSINIDFRPEFLNFDYFKKLSIDYNYLFMSNAERQSVKRSYFNKFEFGYALTCHLAQGSQYDNVLIFDEKLGTKEYYNKWLYTAITRAKKKLIIAK